MGKVEVLKMSEVSAETGIPVNTLSKHYREKKLKGTKNGRYITTTREWVNDYLGITNDDELLKRDYEIQRLKDQIKGYQMRLETFKGLLTTLNQIADI